MCMWLILYVRVFVNAFVYACVFVHVFSGICVLCICTCILMYMYTGVEFVRLCVYGFGCMCVCRFFSELFVCVRFRKVCVRFA